MAVTYKARSGFKHGDSYVAAGEVVSEDALGPDAATLERHRVVVRQDGTLQRYEAAASFKHGNAYYGPGQSFSIAQAGSDAGVLEARRLIKAIYE